MVAPSSGKMVGALKRPGRSPSRRFTTTSAPLTMTKTVSSSSTVAPASWVTSPANCRATTIKNITPTATWGVRRVGCTFPSTFGSRPCRAMPYSIREPMMVFTRAVLATAAMVMKVKPMAGNQGAARSITARKGPGAVASSRHGTTETAVIEIAI